MWRIPIHATYKTGMERICHMRVTNAFELNAYYSHAVKNTKCEY